MNAQKNQPIHGLTSKWVSFFIHGRIEENSRKGISSDIKIFPVFLELEASMKLAHKEDLCATCL